MKVSIYKNVPVKDKELEFKLKLFKIGYRILVALADEKGNRIQGSSLVVFDENMRVGRCICIDESLNLPLNDNKQLESKEEKEYEW